MNGDMVDYEIVAPDPAGTIQSLSSLGYSLESAIADLVDNSIDADASTVDVAFHWDGSASHVAVIDDGNGMGEKELVTAMALAAKGPGHERAEDELGRFGMGLKTASFSQARQLTVWTRPKGLKKKESGLVRVWDLPEVVRTGQWRLGKEADSEVSDWIDSYSSSMKRGTVVFWKGLTNLVEADSSAEDERSHAQFLTAIEDVAAHLSMVFSRFLTGRKRITIRVNGVALEPWDPFLGANKFTEPLPPEFLAYRGSTVVVRPFVLPPKKRLSDEEYKRAAGPRGWIGQQGFYVYRNDRLIVAGDWLGIGSFRKDEKHVLARIAIDVPGRLDSAWSVDVKKATARPPIDLRGQLIRVGKVTREKAYSVLTSLSRTTAITKSDELSYVWDAESKDGELRLHLNWQHPLVRSALESSNDGKPVVRSLLRFIEETVPVSALRIMFDEETQRHPEPFNGVPPRELVAVATHMLEAYTRSGMSPAQAAHRLVNTEPFNAYPDLPDLLGIASTTKRKAAK